MDSNYFVTLFILMTNIDTYGEGEGELVLLDMSTSPVRDSGKSTLHPVMSQLICLQYQQH